jgi:competence protein ComEA
VLETVVDQPSDPLDPTNSPTERLAAPFADLTDRVRTWVRWVGPGRIATAAGAAVVIAAVGWWLLRSPQPPTEARLTSATHVADETIASSAGPAPAPAVTPTSSTPGSVVVHVAGSVVAPGVYELPAGSRVADAIAAAGGATADAEPDAMNLAAPVVDGDRIAVPRRGEPLPVSGAGGVSHAATDGAEAIGPVNVNTATIDQLDALPGVGPATAAAIVAHRDANGPFVRVEDLEAVRGIGPAKLDALRDLVTV